MIQSCCRGRETRSKLQCHFRFLTSLCVSPDGGQGVGEVSVVLRIVGCNASCRPEFLDRSAEAAPICIDATEITVERGAEVVLLGVDRKSPMEKLCRLRQIVHLLPLQEAQFR